MAPKDARANSGFWAFWSSLPGILTGTAAVIAAAATLAAVFAGGEGGGAPSGAAPSTESAYTAPVAGPDGRAGDGCLSSYFAGVAGDRVDRVEAGTTNYDVVSESQTKAGTIGIVFTESERPIGAMRLAFIANNRVFKIESVVDAGCRQVRDHENVAGGDSSTLEDSGTVRLRFAGRSYDLTTIAWGSAIRVNFVAVVP